MFRKYHYLNTELNSSSKCYLMTANDNIAGFMAVITFPHPTRPYKKVHRLVILPDYQGLGLGVLFLNHIAAMYKYPFSITTSQPALIHALAKNNKWICINNTKNTRDKKQKGRLGARLNKSISSKRIISTFAYKDSIQYSKKIKRK